MLKTQKKRCKNRKNQKRNVDKKGMELPDAQFHSLIKIQITDSKPYRRI